MEGFLLCVFLHILPFPSSAAGIDARTNYAEFGAVLTCGRWFQCSECPRQQQQQNVLFQRNNILGIRKIEILSRYGGKVGVSTCASSILRQ